MSHDDQRAIAIVAALALLVGMIAGWHMGASDMKQGAVKAGKAEYVPDEHGGSMWRWKP